MNKYIRIKHLSITVSINILIMGIHCNYIMYIYIVFATCPQTEVPAVPTVPARNMFLSIWDAEDTPSQKHAFLGVFPYGVYP